MGPNNPQTNVPITDTTSSSLESSGRPEGGAISNNPTPSQVVPSRPFIRTLPFSKNKALVTLVVTGMVVLLTAGAVVIFSAKDASNRAGNSVSNTPVQDVTIKNPIELSQASELKGSAESLLVNGNIITKGTIQVINKNLSATVKADNLTQNRTYQLPDSSGTICLDSNNCSYATLTQLQGIGAQFGRTVTSLNGQSGVVTLSGGDGVSINGLVISNSGLLSVGGQTGNLSVGLGLSASGGNLVNTGVVGLVSSNSTIDITSTGNGVFDLKVGPTSGGVALGPAIAQDDPSNNSSININKTGTGNFLQFSTGGTTKFTLGQNGLIGNAYGGTGLNSAAATDGQLLIGNGSGFTLANLVKATGSFITITNTAGGIEIGNTPIDCSTCANNQLSNLDNPGGVSGVSINADLLTASNAIDLGSVLKPFGELYLAGSQATRANNFKITGTPNAAYTLNLDNVDGKIAVVQSGGALTQAGNILINGYVSADTLVAITSVSSPLITTAVTAGDSANLSIRSGIAAGTSGNVNIDSGAGATKGSLSFGDTNASAITIGRIGLVPNLPGGLTTTNGNINAGTGTITSGAINGQTISSTANFTNKVTIQGADALTLGASTTATGAIVFNNIGGSNTVKLKASDTNPASSFTITLPSALPGGSSCLNISAAGQIGTQGCSSGLGGSGSPNTIVKFDALGTSVEDSLLTQSGSAINLFGATNNATLAVGTSITIGVNGATNPKTGFLILNDGTDPGRTLSVQAQPAGASYTLQLPASTAVGSSCLILETVSAGVNRIVGSTCAAGGSGGNITASGGSTNDKLVRFTNNGAAYTAVASLVQDNGSTVGINATPQSDLFTVGSANAFRVTDAGAISAVTTITATGLIQSSAGTQGLTLSGAPVAGTGITSLVQLGSAISGGNAITNGGTYFGINAPASGAGSAADFIDFQAAGTKKLVIDKDGNFTTAGTYKGLTLQTNAGGFQISGGVTSKTLTVSQDSTINQNLSTTSTVLFNALTLTNALGIGYGGTGLATLPDNNKILLGTSGNAYEQRTLTAGTGITFDKTVAGVFTINSSGGGGGSCSTCANKDLGNIASVAIPDGADLKPAVAGMVNLGATGTPFGDLWLAGTNGTPANNRYKITGSGNTTGLKTLTLPNFDGTFTVLQATGSSAQGGATDELNIAGLVLAGKLRSPELKTIDVGSGSQGILIQTGASGNASAVSGNITLQSGTANAGSGTSGNIVLDVGTAFTPGNILLSSSQRAKVGIGVSDPNTALDLLGGLTIRSSTAPTLAPTDQGRFYYDATADTVKLSLNGGVYSNVCTVLSCTGDSSGATLQIAYNKSTGLTTPEILLDATRNAVDIQDANTTLGATTNLLAVRASATATTLGTLLFGVQGSGAATFASLQPATGNAADVITATGGKGADTATAGNGSNIVLTSGAGGDGATANGNGGNITLQGGAAGSGAGTAGTRGNVLLQSSGGNVGVGTASPTAKLHVVGGNGSSGVTGSAGITGLVVVSGNGGNSSGASTAGGAAGVISLTSGNGGNSTGTVGVNGGAITITAGNGGNTTGAFANSNGGAINFQGGSAGTGGSGASGSYGSISLQASGGNVGIGTLTPTASLSFGNTSAKTINVLDQGSSNNNGGATLNIVSGNAGTLTTGAAGGGLNLSAGNAGGTGNNNGGDVTLNGGSATGSGTRGNIILQANGGNVGIGTNSPTALLDVTPATTGPGTVSKTSGGFTLTGIGTTFSQTFKVGDQITVDDETTRVITVVSSNTSLTISSAFSVTSSGRTYVLGTVSSRLAVGANGIINVGNSVNPTAILTVQGATPASVDVGSGITATAVLKVVGGAGGSITAGSSNSGDGSLISLLTGAGGSVGGNGTGAGGIAGLFSITTGLGGNFSSSAASGSGGAGGAVNISVGKSGTSKAATGVNGSNITLTAGAGGDTTSTGNNSTGGNITLQGGAPGAGGTGTNGNYGNVLLAGNGGNVGIGVSSPTTKLEIVGPVGITSLATPSAPTVVPQGSTGSTTWVYRVSAITANGESSLSLPTQITNGNASLNANNYNQVSWSAVAGASGYNVYRFTTGGAVNTIKFIKQVPATITQVNDTGLADGATKNIDPTSNKTLDTSSYLGVGTNAPTVKFHVAGTELFQATETVSIQNSAGAKFLSEETTRLNNFVPNPSFEISTTGYEPNSWAPMPAPAAPTVGTAGTAGTARWGYRIVATTAAGDGPISDEAIITTGNRVLNSTNKNQITLPVIAGTTYKVYRTTVNNNQANGPTPTITPQGTTGSTTWKYRIVAVTSSGDTPGSAEGTTTTGNATLTSTNFNRVSWSSVAGATHYRVYRSVAGTSPSTTGYIGDTTLLQLDDTGLSQLSAGIPTESSPNTIGLIVSGQAGGTFEDTGLSASGSAPTSSNIVRVDSTTSKFGTTSMKVTTGATVNDGTKSSSTLTLTSGQPYTLSFYAKGSGAFSLTPGYLDGNGESTCSTASVTTSWNTTAFTCTFTPDSTTSVGYIFFKQTDNTARTFNLDGVQLETGSVASNYTEASLVVYNTASTAILTVDHSTSQVTIGSLANGVSFNGSSFEPVLSGTARHDKTMVISPEYVGAVLSGDGSSATVGTLTADNAGSGASWRNYYQWSTSQTTNQDYTIMVRVTLPSDFESWQTGTSCPGATCAMDIAYQTGLSDTTNNGVSAIINSETDSPGSPTCTMTESASTSWSNIGCTSSQLTGSPAWNGSGKTAIIRIKMKASAASAKARVGDITLRYKSKF